MRQQHCRQLFIQSVDQLLNAGHQALFQFLVGYFGVCGIGGDHFGFAHPWKGDDL
jgi:hypothetical protein